MQRADVTSVSRPAAIAGFSRVSPMARAPRLVPAAVSVDQSGGVVGAGRCFRFGRFVLQMRERRLLADGMPVDLGSRALDVLAVLAESGGGLLTKSMIMDRVWPDVAVEENNLQVQISNLRRVFGVDRGWIVTIPGRGYRFTAPVDTAPLPGAVKTARPLSVLVLPFAARGSDPALDWFVDGVTDSLTTDLAHAVPRCSVVAHATAAQYKSQPVDVREIGRAQQVRFVLEGTILLAEHHVRVNAQLIETESGASLWSERFDQERGDVLQVQDEIVVRLSRMAGLQMINAEAERAERVECERPEVACAAGFMMRGLAAARLATTEDKLNAACALFGRALDLDPDNLDALVGTASLRTYSVVNGFVEKGQTVLDDARREASLTEAQEKLERALTLSPGYDPAMKVQALLWRARGRFTDALAANAAILTRNPGDLPSHRESGLNLMYLGRFAEACQWFRRADDLAPVDPMRWSWLQGLGRVLVMLGRDGEAVEALRLAVENNPRNPAVHAWHAAALALSGDMDAARVALDGFRHFNPDLPIEVFAQRTPVPLETTDPLYRKQHQRLIAGLLAAG